MIDKIRLTLPRTDIIDRIENPQRTDVNTYYGNIGNVKVRQTLGGLRLEGSIAKYLHGQNVRNLTRPEMKAAIEKLEADIGLDLRQAVLCGVECGASIITKEKPHEYLALFGNCPRMTCAEYSTSEGIGTKDYYTETGAQKFTAYDKTKEAMKRKMPIPELYQNKNVLRLEYKITKRRGIKAAFGRELTAHDLYEHGVYRALQAAFLRAYQCIEKRGRIVFVDISKPITPKDLTEAEAERYRQSCPKEHRQYLQTLKENGALTAKSAERIRAAERKAGKDYTMSEKNPLIDELDTHIKNIALDGA